MKKILTLAFLFSALLFVNVKAQSSATPQINWLTIQEAEELCKTSPKKIFVDFYTDWCGWCKVMDKKTFSNPSIATYISQNYYAVKFDAETHDTIMFKGKEYINKGLGKRPTHDLAVELLNGKMSYPTMLYMDEKLNPISPVSGYMAPDKIEPLLIFFGQDVYKQTSYDLFNANFEKTFKDSIQRPELVNWYTFEEANELNKVVPKKIILHLYADYNILSKIMHKTTFNHSEIAKYINDNYYPIVFDVLSKDTIHFNGNIFINENKEHPFHQLAVSLLQGKMSFPQVIYLGEQGNLISAVPGYLSPVIMEPIMCFFNENAFAKMQFDEYRKTFKSKLLPVNE